MLPWRPEQATAADRNKQFGLLYFGR